MMKKVIVLTLGLTFYFLNTECDFVNEGEKNIQFELTDEDYDYRAGFDEGTNNGENFNFIAISLGSRCSAAGFLRDYNIRPFAFPFDWCITPYKALYNFIKNDFKEFFKKDNLIPGQSAAWFFDKESGMAFPHDFPNNLIETMHKNYEEQNKKYLRRIKRFYEKINSGKHVYFIRLDRTTKMEAIDIYTLLKKKFPQISFTLFVIGNDYNEFSNDWKHPHIKNFFYLDIKDMKSIWDNIYEQIINDTLKK